MSISSTRVIAGLVLICLSTSCGLAQEPTPAAKVDKSLADSPRYKHGIYLETGLSALIFQPPERKSFSVYNDDLPFMDSSQSGLRFDSSDLSVMPRLAIGYQFDHDRTPHLLGEDLRVEFASTFFMSEKGKNTLLPPTRLTHGYTAVGYSDALLYGPTGSVDYCTLNVVGPPAPGTLLAPRANVRLTAEYEQLDLNLGARTTYTLVEDRLRVSPYLGFTRQTLDQDFKLLITNLFPAGLPISQHYSAKEELATEAYGATVGLDFTVQILNRLSFTVGATVSPLWAHTDMRLRYAVREWNALASLSETSGLKREKDSFSYRAGAHVGFSYDVTKRFSIGANGGVDYWNDVPTVQYPVYGPTERIWPSSRTPSIGHDHMLNWMGGVTLIFRFGGP